jgi:PBSX family phage portal protein
MTETISDAADVARPAAIEAFTFGDAEPVLDRRELFDLFQTQSNGLWYEPPVPPVALGRTYRMSPHHQSAILLKRNLLAGSFVPSRWFTRQDFAKWALDWLIMGNAYLERVDNLASKPLALKPALAAYTRVGVKADQFWFVRPGVMQSAAHEFRPGSVFHLNEPDPLQEIYGMPEYLSALQSGLLNESATIFRRRYYDNGSHAGFILYLSEPTMSEQDAEALRKALRDSKGRGNFKNLFVHAPQGKKDGIQLIPISEVAAKDEFLNIKEVTRDDVLAAHRVPPQLLGVVPKNTGGFGNVIDAARTFYELEIVPIQTRMLELNDWLGLPAISFQSLADSGMLARVVAAPAPAMK